MEKEQNTKKEVEKKVIEETDLSFIMRVYPTKPEHNTKEFFKPLYDFLEKEYNDFAFVIHRNGSKIT